MMFQGHFDPGHVQLSKICQNPKTSEQALLILLNLLTPLQTILSIFHTMVFLNFQKEWFN